MPKKGAEYSVQEETDLLMNFRAPYAIAFHPHAQALARFKRQRDAEQRPDEHAASTASGTSPPSL